MNCIIGTYRFSHNPEGSDILLTNTLPTEEYNLALDITLNKSLHVPGLKGHRVIDLSLKKQRSFLLSQYCQIMERINSTSSRMKISSLLIVYEIQMNTGTVHAHANLRIECAECYLAWAKAEITNLVKRMGFIQYFAEYIKYPIERNNYIMKADTKYPNLINTVRYQ